MILFSHPEPTSTVRHAACALHRAGILGEFWTYLGEPERRVLRRVEPSCLSIGALVSAGGRDEQEPAPVDLPLGHAVQPEDTLPDARVLRSLDREMRARLLRENFAGVYASENGAEASFRAAGRLSLLRVYQLPLGNAEGPHPILDEEAAREPEWAPTMAVSLAARRRYTRMISELHQADLVFVGSTFGLRTIETTAGVKGAIAIAPPGAANDGHEDDWHAEGRRYPRDGAPLRVLYAGPMSQRAGLSYAFQACRRLGRAVELTVVAPAGRSRCRPLERELARVRWINTASAAVIRHEMSGHDVFLYPAVYDTRASVLLQALAWGLPVIATPNSAAPDLIRDGDEGFIVPVRSADVIAARLERLHRSPDLLAEMSVAARLRAREHTWDRYEAIVAASVASALATRAAS